MIDLHTHLLPGVDDGSRTLDTSVRVLERMAAEGVTVVACTPHLDASRVDEAPVEAHARLRETVEAAAREALQARGPEGGELAAALQLVAGYEVMLDRPGCELRGKGIALGASRAVLVEFPRHGVPAGAAEELLRVRSGGMIPVVAHPERYRGVTVETMHAWREVGAVLQGDALMLLSTGPMADLARAMLAEGVYDILASDNHGDRRSLSTVRLWLRAMGGDDAGRLLTVDNPRRLLADEPLLPVPPVRRERSWWEQVKAWVTRS